MLLYLIDMVDNIAVPSVGEAPKNIFFLTADAFGVLPPISKLTPSQAMYNFISGYTAKKQLSLYWSATRRSYRGLESAAKTVPLEQLPTTSSAPGLRLMTETDLVRRVIARMIAAVAREQQQSPLLVL